MIAKTEITKSEYDKDLKEVETNFSMIIIINPAPPTLEQFNKELAIPACSSKPTIALEMVLGIINPDPIMYINIGNSRVNTVKSAYFAKYAIIKEDRKTTKRPKKIKVFIFVFLLSTVTKKDPIKKPEIVSNR